MPAVGRVRKAVKEVVRRRDASAEVSGEGIAKCALLCSAGQLDSAHVHYNEARM